MSPLTSSPLDRRWNRVDWLAAALLFLFFSSLYYATASGITSSNDGSHYALLRTMVENRSFALQQFDDYAEGNDIAIAEDGRLFSDRPPGTALAGSLFYLAGERLPTSPAPLPSRHDAENPRLAYVLLLPVFAGSAALVLLYALIRELAIARLAAATAVVCVGLGTIHWKYSTVLFSHALSSFLVMASLLLTITIVERTREVGPLVYGALGLILGYAVLTEYSNVPMVIILVGYLLLGLRPLSWRKILPAALPLLAGGSLAAFFLAVYNASSFGSPWRLSYSYATNYPWAGSFSTTFNFPLWEGLKGLLVGGTGDGWCDGPCPNQGLFVLSPILLLTLPGWFLFYRHARRESLLVALLFLTYLLLFAQHRTFHGFTADGRYLAPFLGLLGIPLACMVQWIYALEQRRTPLLLLSGLGVLFLWSVRNIFLHIGTSYNYRLDPHLLASIINRPLLLPALLAQVFRNTANLPLLWLLEGVFAALVVGTLLVLHKITGEQVKRHG